MAKFHGKWILLGKIKNNLSSEKISFWTLKIVFVLKIPQRTYLKNLVPLLISEGNQVFLVMPRNGMYRLSIVYKIIIGKIIKYLLVRHVPESFRTTFLINSIFSTTICSLSLTISKLTIQSAQIKFQNMPKMFDEN